MKYEGTLRQTMFYPEINEYDDKIYYGILKEEYMKTSKIKLVAIVGDFSVYTSKSLRDFIYECNNGKDIFFLPDEKQAVEKLSMY